MPLQNGGGVWGASTGYDLSASYSYGYGGGRTDLPASGYNPDYTSSSIWGTYNPGATSNPEPLGYNPVYPTYDSRRNAYTQEVYSQQQGYVGSFFGHSNETNYSTDYHTVSHQQSPRRTQASIVFLDKTRLGKKTPVTGQRPKPVQSQRQKPVQTQPIANSNTDSTSKLKNDTKGGNKPTPKEVKVARIGKPNKAKRGSVSNLKTIPLQHQQKQRMPNYQGANNAWGVPWIGNNPTTGRGASRGGRGGGFRGGRGGFRGRGGYSKPNSKEDIPFAPIPAETPSISLAVNIENFVAFHGFDSVFTTQHSFPVLIEKHIYESCDHYYQIRKVVDLCGSESVTEKLSSTVRDENGHRIDGKNAPRAHDSKSFSVAAREILKQKKIEKTKIDEWRLNNGLETIQKSLMAKVCQSAHLREALKETGNAILIHAFAGDSIYGTGCTVPRVKKWLEDLEKSGAKTIEVPAEFPMTQETVKMCPTFAEGRNILGVILMQLRALVVADKISIVDMSTVFNALRVADEKITEIDFHMDDDGLTKNSGTPSAGTF